MNRHDPWFPELVASRGRWAHAISTSSTDQLTLAGDHVFAECVEEQVTMENLSFMLENLEPGRVSGVEPNRTAQLQFCT